MSLRGLCLLLLAAALLVSGCTQSPSAPAPSAPPASPTPTPAAGTAVKPSSESASAAKVASWVKELPVAAASPSPSPSPPVSAGGGGGGGGGGAGGGPPGGRPPAASGAPAATSSATPKATSGSASSPGATSGLSAHFGGMDVPSYQSLTQQVSGLRQTVLQKGTAGLYADTSLLSTTLKTLEEKFDDDYKYTAAAGMKYVRSEPGPWVWNLIEPEKGKGYRWEFPDLHVKMARKYGLEPIVTIRHLSGWDTAACGSKASGTTAQVVEQGSFWYLGGYVGPVCSLDDFSTWLDAVADRYDGDGKNDMPGLDGRGLKVWEIFNEVQGPDGGYASKGSEYASVQKRAAEIIKKHCADCIVSNDGAFDLGASPPNSKSSREWFKDAFGAGLGGTIDALNWHWNTERDQVKDESEYRKAVDAFVDLMKGFGVSKPMWITEIGTYTGTSQSGGSIYMGGGSGSGTPSGSPSSSGSPSGSPPSGGKCGDGVCDSIEKQTGGCPADCGTTSKTSAACSIPLCAAGPSLLLSLPGIQAPPPPGSPMPTPSGPPPGSPMPTPSGSPPGSPLPTPSGSPPGSPMPTPSGSAPGSPMPTPSGSPPGSPMPTPSGSPPSGSPPSGSPPSGSPPSSSASPSSGGSTQSEEQQAAWYVQRYAIGFAKGVTLFTPDTMGVSSSKASGGVGTGSLVYRDSPGSSVSARLLFYVHKILYAKIGNFDTVQELDNGQVKFLVSGRPVYILWAPSGSSATLSSSITGSLKVTDLYGNEKTVKASELTLSTTPVFAEPA